MSWKEDKVKQKHSFVNQQYSYDLKKKLKRVKWDQNLNGNIYSMVL